MKKLIKIHPDNPHDRAIKQVVEVLKKGGLVIYPTDTVYGVGCDISNFKAIEKLARIKGVKLNKANFSFICNDLSHLSNYTKPIDNSIFKVMKKALPGPFTFILNAANKLPKAFKNKKTVGIRIPDHKIPQMIVEQLGNPIISTSIYDEDEVLEYTTNPELIFEKYGNLVDLVIDAGYGGNYASTVVDVTQGEFEILREGKGDLDSFL